MALRSVSTGSPGRVLVTGGTGFIGRQTLEPLLEAGYEVVLAARQQPDVPDGVAVQTVDLLEQGAAERLVAAARPSHLLHMAWFVVPGQVWSSFENVRWISASLDLVRAFGEAGGRRAVVAGTCSEYLPGDEPCTEHSTPTGGDTLYGAAKDSVRRLSALMAAELGVSLAWPRVFLAFGPHEHPSRLVASVARNLLAGQPAPCSHGRQLRDFLYSPDIADALVTILASEVTGPVNVASGRPVTVREVVEHIGVTTGRAELIRIGEITPPPHEPPALLADVSRLRDEVGWRPRHDLEAGLEATVDWWRQRLAAAGA